MALLPGTQLGPYEIVAPLGAGGMGEVYRARDLKLNREVALKILPEGLAADPDRMMRFRREAQVLASLQHSNIAAIFGIEDASGSPALAMELVEGETLAERIALGPIPIEEALPIARQVADALEFAHEKGVTHRDLKPANIKIAPDGTAKLLDFGLAKVLDSAVSSSSDPSSSPTFTNAHTQPGMILGTAAYMSPEQAKGKPVDRRTDVWAFGCVLFEMLTRRRAFDGETVTDALAAIIRAEPEWSLLPASTPPGVRQLLHRCLQKDARQRLQAMGEARIVLEEAISAPPGATPNVLAHPGPPSSQASSRSFTLIWALSALAMLATVAALAGWWRVTHPETEPVRRFDLTLAPGEAFNFEGQSPIAISPDGKRIAYALRRGASAQLYVRTLEQLKATPLAGTEGALGPFFSPDGAWIGFIARNHLLKVPSIGGPVVDLSTVNGNNRGASWAPDGSIYIALSATAGLDRVPAAGGRTQPFTTLDPAKKERTHRWPQVLPDGKNVLFTVGSADSPEYYDDAEIDAASTTTGQRTVLLKGASRGFYVSSGHLIYARGGELFAVPFDATRLRVTGTPVSIVQNVAGDTSSGSSFFDVSHSDLIYVSGPSINERDTLAWVDRSGTVRNAPAPPHHYRDLALSPDGQRAAFAIAEHTQDIWVYDFRANTLNRRTFEGQDLAPVWTPNGKRLIYQSNLGAGRHQLRWVPADGSSSSEQLFEADTAPAYPISVSPDGKLLTFEQPGTFGNAPQMQLLSLENERKAAPIPNLPAFGATPTFSPDGHWIAYTSEAGSDFEIFVEPYPSTGGRWQVSSQGGHWAQWSGDGKLLFYVDANSDLVSVPIATKSGFQAGNPQVFYKSLYFPPGSTRNYSVSPDGTRVLMMKPVDSSDTPTRVVIVLNWMQEMQRLAPAPR